MFRESKALVNV